MKRINSIGLIFFCLIGAFAQAETNDPFGIVPPKIMDFHKSISGNACEYNPEHIFQSATVNDVGYTWQLYLIPCVEGAYQVGYRVYVAKHDDSNISQLLFLDWDSRVGLVATADLVSADYDAKSGVLSTFAKGRGMGDCGSTSRHKIIANQDDVLAKLLEIRSKDKCDGKMGVFPKVYPKK